MTRVYVALNRAELAGLASRAVRDDRSAFGVTPALRSAYAQAGVDDEEELEYVAMTVAARVSLTRLDVRDPQDRRRIVVAADAELRSPGNAAGPAPDAGGQPTHPAGVHLLAPVVLAAVVSVHVDTDDVHALVDAAVQALPAAADGDAAAMATVDVLDSEDLAWYAVQELRDLL
ncbi:MAG: hypothetical protein M3419_01360 [Actinomycetota bacterium]|nr:hypothetical protein [Actinomycetota bacterium]